MRKEKIKISKSAFIQDLDSVDILKNARAWFGELATIHQDHLAKKMIFTEIEGIVGVCLEKLQREQARNYGEESKWVKAGPNEYGPPMW